MASKNTKNNKNEDLSTDKNKNLTSAITQIESQFGTGTIMRMGDKKVEDVPSISTGSLGLDLALGVMGFTKRKGSRNIWSRVIWKNYLNSSSYS